MPLKSKLTTSSLPDLTNKQLQAEIHQNHVNIIHARYFHLYNYRMDGMTDDFGNRLRKKVRKATDRFFAKPFTTTLRHVRLGPSYYELDEVNSQTSFVSNLEDMDGTPLYPGASKLMDSPSYELEIVYACRVPGKRMTKAFINYCLKESGYVIA